MAEPALPIRKLLVANRGEIAIRVFRAATELEIATVAVHTRADIGSLHRSKADEAYEIGEEEHPLRPYLDIDTIVRAALACGADAVHPGYGFLSESAALARACAEASLTFVGPTPDVLELAASKVAARGAAEAAGVPTLAQSPALSAVDDAVAWGAEIGFPAVREGGLGRRRAGHAPRRAPRGPCPAPSRRPGARRSRPSARTRSSWRRRCRASATSRCRYSATAPATPSTSSSGTARCSAASRR